MTASIQDALQAIDVERQKIAGFTLPRLQAERLRLGARVRAAYWNAWLEGNRFSADEAAEVLIDGHKFPGREGDILQLKRTYQALEQVEAWGEATKPVDAKNLAKLHAVLTAGKRARPTAYRPDPSIPAHIDALIKWLNQAEESPALQAGIAHYEINAIQPFLNLNTGLARLVAEWVLYLGGYPLQRQAALAEALAVDLPAYQSAIAQPDATAWLEYFTLRLAAAYAQASQLAEQASSAPLQSDTSGRELPRPDARERRVLNLFETQNEISVKDVVRILSLPPNPARQLLESWVEQGWLVKAGQRYRMSVALKRHYPQILDPIP